MSMKLKLVTFILFIFSYSNIFSQTLDATVANFDTLNLDRNEPCPVSLTPPQNIHFCSGNVPILASSCSGTTNTMEDPNSGIVYGVYLYDDGAGNNQAPIDVEQTPIPPGAEFPSFPEALGFPLFLALSQGCGFTDNGFTITNNTCEPKVYTFIYLIYDFDLDLNLDGIAEYIPNCPIERFDYAVYPGFTATIGSFDDCGEVVVNLTSSDTLCNTQTINCKDDGDPSSVTIEAQIDTDGTIDGMGTLEPIIENPNGSCNTFTVECPVTPIVDVGESGTICPNEGYEVMVSYEDMLNPIFDGAYLVTSNTPGSCTVVPTDSVTEVNLGDDDFSNPIPLGFNFNFWGNTYTDFYIGSNGYVTFGMGSTEFSGQPIPSTADPNNIIALFWVNIDPSDYSGAGTISYYNSNIAGQNCLVVDFDQINYCCFGFTYGTVSGQIIMCEDGTIIINCIDCQLNNYYYYGAISGIENSDGSDGYFDPLLIDGQYVGIDSYVACTTFTPILGEPPTCTFLYWVTDLNDPTGSIVSTEESTTFSPAVTTTYYAIVECEDGIQCVDEITVGIDVNCCSDPIAGQIIAPFECDLSGIEVVISIINDDGSQTIVGTATTDAAGNYTLLDPDTNDLWSCGDYSAMLMLPLPDCYADAAGNQGPTGPITFTVDGDGNADGAVFAINAEVPTLSQWGLIILTLLLMNFGAIILLKEDKLFNKKLA